MQVNVFISNGEAHQPIQLLVIPFGPGHFIPKHLDHISWRAFGTADASDPLLGSAAAKVRADLARIGYSLVHAAEGQAL